MLDGVLFRERTAYEIPRIGYFARVSIYVIMLSIAIFKSNLVAIYAPDSHDTRDVKNLNEVFKNSLSVVCALGLTYSSIHIYDGCLKI